MSLTRTNITNPCPVCEDSRGKCRQSKEDQGYWQCMTYADSRKGEVINGLKCLGHTRDGFWGQFRLDNTADWTEQQRLEWQRENQRRRQEKAREDDERRRRSLSVEQRHEQYTRLLAELTLHPDDRADLVRRGFTDEQIELSGFKSISPWQKLKGTYDDHLPGVSSDKLVFAYEGTVCPVRNHNGLIVSCQVRRRYLQEDDSNRYRWLSSKKQTLHLFPGESDGELPIASFHPQGKPDPIIAIVEGTGAKPFLASQRLNMIAIGAAGGQFASSPNLFKAALEKGAEAIGQKVAAIFPDAGDIQNPSVMRRWKRIISFLELEGWEVNIGWWEQKNKDCPDIDELDPALFESEIGYIEPQEFLELAGEKVKKKSNIVGTSIWNNWVSSRKFTPDIKLNQKYFEFPSNIPTNNAIIAGKDGLGGGKTAALIRLIARLGMGSRLVGYRNTLLHQTISRFHQDAGISYQHLRDDDSFLFLKDKDSHIAFCLDSITHSEAHWFQDTVVILDETVSVLLHGISAGTIGSRQSECLALLREALKECELVICLDGNLRDIDIELIQRLSGGKEVVKIENHYKREPHQITFVSGVDPDGELKKGDRSPLVKALMNPDCVPWISCDARDRALTYAEMMNQVNKTGYVLCSLTKNEPWAKEFLLDPTAFIKRYKPGYMIISPSGESGLDCHGNGHFTHKFSFFSGVLPTNSQTQIMFRLRDNIPHYVFCSEVGMVKDRNTPKTYSAKQFEQATNDFTLQSAELAFKLSGKDFIQGILESALAKSDFDYWQYSCTLGALDNFEIDNLRECLIYALKQSRHQVEEVEWQICPKTKEWEKSALDTIQIKEAKEIFAAKDIDFEEAQKLKRKDGTKEINRQVQKAFFLNRLPKINEWDGWNKDVSPDNEGFPTFAETYEGSDFMKGGELLLYLNKTDRNYIFSLERLWQLKNFSIAQKRHEKRWFEFANKDELNKVEARKRGTAFNTIWALNKLNLLHFLDGEWCADSPEIIELEEKGSTPEISLALGLNPSDPQKGNKQRIEYLNKLLKLIGCRLDSPVNRGTKKRQRFYQVLTNLRESNLIKKYHKKKEPIPQSLWWNDWESPFRLALNEAINRKFTQWAAENQGELQWHPESPLESQGYKEVEESISIENEDLMESFNMVEDLESFKFVAPCFTDDQIESAIAFQPNQPRRKELDGYWDAFKSERHRLEGVYQQSSCQSENSGEMVEVQLLFKAGDRVTTPQGEGNILYFNEDWQEYNVAFPNCTDYFKPGELRKVEDREVCLV